jgi:glucose/mannose-6-phosphate isomerase
MQTREQIDTQNIYEVIKNIPKQFPTAFEDTKISFDSRPQKIIFCGVGGSALPVNLVKTFISASRVHFPASLKIHRDYSLPASVDSEWCGFFISYSGNTDETLSALSEAETRGLKEIIVMAHGGKLQEIAEEKGYKFIQIPDFNQPRLAYGYIFGAIIKTLSNSGLLEINFNNLIADAEKIGAYSSVIESKGQELATILKNKIGLVYASNQWKYLAMIWKINLNENAKQPCFWNAFPEMNHNEMVGFTNKAEQFQAIIIRDPSDAAQIQKRMTVFKDLFKDSLQPEIIDMPPASPFYKMLYCLSLGLWTSYQLAILNETDPAPVELVEKFKKLLV